MERTTHAKITINEAGETEVRQVDVVKEVQPGRRHSLLNIDVRQAIDKIDAAESAAPTKAEIEAAADKLAAWCTRVGKSELGERLDEASNILYEAVDRWSEYSATRPAE